MRYDQQAFDDAVAYYKEELKGAEQLYVYGQFNRAAFFSMAPLSRAAAELGIDMSVSFGHHHQPHETLFKVWEVYGQLKNGTENKKTDALKKLFDHIDIKGFDRYFERPDTIIEVHAEEFSDGMRYKMDWFRPFMADKLKETTDAIVENVYALQEDELFGIGFALVMDRKFLSHPLQDYLDSYAICYSMFLSSKDICSAISIKASTPRKGSRDEPETVSELATTLVGLELEKEIDEPVFAAYKKLSSLLDISIRIPDANFFISAKGYHGKHIFGEKRGYPTRNKKTKWNSPGGMIYKFHWYPQSEHEDRPPLSRVSFTSTVPIDKLIESTLIDYKEMRMRNKQIAAVMEQSEKVVVESKDGSNFEVGLVKNGVHRKILPSDSDTRYKIHPRILKETGKQMGMMANIPGGEAFTTPAYVKGRIIGDVVINIDRSYRLKEPFIAESDEEGYSIVSGPKDVVKAFEQKKKEAWDNIIEQEKNGSLSPEIIALKKSNFNRIGEFAINTNPKAKLCDYLIINEKIANMIHVAFGSGFEPDAATEYHMDVVIDSPKQELDIYGVADGKKVWIIRKGKFVI